MLLLLAAVAFLGNIFIPGMVALGMGRMSHIGNVPLLRGALVPEVSVVIPACNEEATIAPALESILGFDYPNLEVIVVNDRSTDNTGEVLEEFQKKYSALNVYTITELPPGWLGKSHALQFGAKRARGEYLLFTDADIIMERTVLARAMLHMLAKGLDHLSMVFGTIAKGGLLNALFMEIGDGLLLYFRPWKVKDPESKCFMGVGAFNLVKAETYRAIGGHSSIALHPIDDIMLGRTIKENGYSQDCLLGKDFVDVSWYGSVGELIEGLMKNVFAAHDFQVAKVLGGLALIFILYILPVWGAIFASGPTSFLFSAAVAIRVLSCGKGFHDNHLSPWYAPWSLITPYIHIYIIVRATVTTLVNRGITWRGTFYPLADLKHGNLKTFKDDSDSDTDSDSE